MVKNINQPSSMAKFPEVISSGLAKKMWSIRSRGGPQGLSGQATKKKYIFLAASPIKLSLDSCLLPCSLVSVKTKYKERLHVKKRS